jgi:hypothetical protein
MKVKHSLKVCNFHRYDRCCLLLHQTTEATGRRSFLRTYSRNHHPSRPVVKSATPAAALFSLPSLRIYKLYSGVFPPRLFFVIEQSAPI